MRLVVNDMTVAVLFARADSNYNALPDVEVYDIERDARTYDGPWPVVAHPPCRAWGQLAKWSKPRPDERNLARLAVALVREFGGVLEHPARSSLWPAQGLPECGERDQWGGWTLPIVQMWWGHRAEKRTRLYIVGCEPADLPTMPLILGEATHTIGLWSGRQAGHRPDLPKAEREHTPPALAAWLVEVAAKCKTHNAEITGSPKASPG